MQCRIQCKDVPILQCTNMIVILLLAFVHSALSRCSKISFTVVFQMSLYGECYEKTFKMLNFGSLVLRELSLLLHSLVLCEFSSLDHSLVLCEFSSLDHSLVLCEFSLLLQSNEFSLLDHSLGLCRFSLLDHSLVLCNFPC
jgi:hypothetical protein